MNVEELDEKFELLLLDINNYYQELLEKLNKDIILEEDSCLFIDVMSYKGTQYEGELLRINSNGYITVIDTEYREIYKDIELSDLISIQDKLLILNLIENNTKEI